MNAYQERLIKNSEKLSNKRIMMRLLSLLIFPLGLGVGYLCSDLFNRFFHGWLDLWMAIYMLLALVGGIYLIMVTLVCKLMFLVYDKVVPYLDIQNGYVAADMKGEAMKHLTKIRYGVNSMLVKFLKNGCLGKGRILYVLDIFFVISLFCILVSVGYVWTGVFYGFCLLVSFFSASYFRGMIYANVYRLEDTLGGEENLDDLSDQLFNGGR